MKENLRSRSLSASGLKIISDPQLQSKAKRLFAVFALVRSVDEARLETKIQVRDPRIGHFRRDRETAVVQVENSRDRRREVEDVEGLLLGNPQIEIIPHRVGPAVIALGKRGGLLQGGGVAG